MQQVVQVEVLEEIVALVHLVQLIQGMVVQVDTTVVLEVLEDELLRDRPARDGSRHLYQPLH